MHYELIGKNDYMIDPLRCVLENRGVSDIDKFFNIDKSVIHDYKLLDNIDKGVDLLLNTVREMLETGNGSVYIQNDSDMDGYTSSALKYNYLKKITNGKLKIIYGIHKKKHHGIISKDVPDGVKLVLVLDAGSNDYEELEKLHKRGIKTIICDHHQCSRYSEHAIVINNQMCNYPNKDFSGVGITYKFCKAIDERIGKDYADDYLDLVAIGNIADLMSTKSLETRYYILEGLKKKNIKNPFLKALIEKQDYSMGGIVNITNIAFYIAPLINATIRIGTYEEKVNMFKAFLEDCNETILYKKRGSKEEIKQSLPETMARICTNVRSKQARIRDKAVAMIEEKIKTGKIDENKVMIVNGTGILDKGLTGLVAMQLTQKYKRPVIILQMRDSDKNIFGGSGRGYERSGITDFRKFVLDTNMFDMAEGHDNAFGVGIKAKNVLKACEIMNSRLDSFTFEDIYHVDFIIPIKHCNTKLMKVIAENKDIWGRDVEEPLIAVENIIINRNDIQLVGKNKNTIKFSANGIDFIKFKANRDEYEDMMQYNTIEINLIGKCSVNEWQGNKTYQLIIEDMSYKKSNLIIF